MINDGTTFFTKYCSQEKYIKLTTLLRLKMPSNVWGYGVITGIFTQKLLYLSLHVGMHNNDDKHIA